MRICAFTFTGTHSPSMRVCIHCHLVSCLEFSFFCLMYSINCATGSPEKSWNMTEHLVAKECLRNEHPSTTVLGRRAHGHRTHVKVRLSEEYPLNIWVWSSLARSCATSYFPMNTGSPVSVGWVLDCTAGTAVSYQASRSSCRTLRLSHDGCAQGLPASC